MKTYLLFLITLLSLEINAQKQIERFNIDQKGVPLADSKNPYSLASLIRYNQLNLQKNKLFTGLDSVSLAKIEMWNKSYPKEKIGLNSFLRQSDTPLKNEKGEIIEVSLPDGTITYQYPAPDTIYYSVDYNQIALIYNGKNEIPETIQLYRKTSKNSFLLAEFPADLLTQDQLITYYRIDPVTEQNYINRYLKHVENTKIRFGKNGISRLVIKDIRKNYLDEVPFYEHLLFDSLYSINDQKAKLQQVLRKPMNLVYDTSYYSRTNAFGDDSLVRDPKLGDLITVMETQVDTLLSINEIHSMYKKQRIDYNAKTKLFEVTGESILICLEDLQGNRLIIDKIGSLPYQHFTTKEDIHQRAIKYDLNNNPLMELLSMPAESLGELFEVKKSKQKKGKGVELSDTEWIIN